MILAVIRGIDAMSEHQPLTDSGHPQWNQGHIRSKSGKERWAYAGMALFWNALSQPMFWLTVLNQSDISRMGVALAALFPLVGAGLAYVAIIKWIQWRRFGDLELHMDPFPGSIGGDVGGSIEIPLEYRAGKYVEVSLSCINVVVRRGHKNNKRSEHVVWRERAEIPVEPGMRGTRAKFLFKVPVGHPATSEPSDNCHQWIVHLHRSLPGADLDQSFELPVFDTGTPLQARHLRHYSTLAGESGEVPPGDVEIDRTTEGIRLFYPRSRNRGIGLMLLVFGATFGIAPWLIGTHFGDIAGGDLFGILFAIIGGFFVLVFGLIGLSLLGAGVYSLLNSLEVEVSSQGIASTRRILGFRFRQAASTEGIQQLRYKITAQQGQGAKASVRYLLEAVPSSGKPVCLGDGIKGKPLARHLMQQLGTLLSHSEWIEAQRMSASRKYYQS